MPTLAERPKWTGGRMVHSNGLVCESASAAGLPGPQPDIWEGQGVGPRKVLRAGVRGYATGQEL